MRNDTVEEHRPTSQLASTDRPGLSSILMPDPIDMYIKSEPGG